MVSVETWKPILYFPYEASTKGRIRRKETGKILKTFPGGGRTGDYYRLQICMDGQRKTFNVHVLVAIAFHGDKRSDGFHVDHINGDHENNSPENLRWIPSHINVAIANRNRNRCKETALIGLDYFAI